MAINFKKWLLEKLSNGEERVSSREITGNEFFDLSAELYFRELAFFSCVNVVANAISKCEIKTFVNKKEVKEEEYYLWNIQPNKNQNSSGFMHKLISQLYKNNEVLVIDAWGDLLVADSFAVKEYALFENLYSDVVVGDYKFDKTFAQSEVMFLKLSDRNMKVISDGIYGIYQNLINYTMKSYKKSRGNRGILMIDTLAEGDPRFEEKFKDLMEKYFKSFYEADNAVLPLFKGYSYTDIGSKTYSNEGTRDIKAMINDVSDLTAKAFNIPPALLSGEVEGTKEAFQQFLTFTIDPLCDMLEEEIIRKRYGFKGFKNGSYVKIDTSCIEHIDILNVANAIDKLISSGAFCVNDIRKATGQEIIDEPWAWEHFMTKNYATIEELLKQMEGGKNE